MIGEITFYQHPGPNYRNECQPGQLFLAPMPFMLDSRVPRLRLDYYDKKKPYNSSYTIEEEDIQSFRPEDVKPIYPLRLSASEFALCMPHKFRPVIILSQEMPSWKDYQETYAECYIVVPLYTTKDAVEGYKFSEKFLLKTQAYQYPTLFYLPEDSQYGIRESIARFERSMAINRKLLKPIPASLSDDALYCLTEWFYYFLEAKELNEILKEYREAALKQLRAE